MQHTSRTKGSRYIDPSGGEPDTGTVIERAEYKLRQTDLLLAYLRHQSNEIALAQRQASSVAEDGKLRLDTFFFASLEAARSSYFILEKAGPHWKRVLDQWKADPSAKDAVDRFDAMVTLRGQDVHHGCAPSEAMGTMIPIEDHGSAFGEHYNSAIFGPRVMTTYTTPDGTTVSSAHGLQGSMGLYVDLVGKRYEGSVACAAFIGQLRALIATVKSAPTAV